jgi:hypothetical protein
VRHTCHVKSRALGIYLKHLDHDLFMHMFVSHACGGGPRTLTHAITTEIPIRSPAWSITFDGACERGLIKGGFILVHVSANIMVRLRTKVWAHVCTRVLIVQVVNLRFFDLRRCHMKGVHWVFKTSHNTSVHMLGQHGGGGCPRTPPPSHNY